MELGSSMLLFQGAHASTMVWHMSCKHSHCVYGLLIQLNLSGAKLIVLLCRLCLRRSGACVRACAIGCGSSALPLWTKCFEVHSVVRRLKRTIPGMQHLLLNLLATNTCNNRALVESCLVRNSSLESNKLFCTVLNVLPGQTISLRHSFALSPNLVSSFLI